MKKSPYEKIIIKKAVKKVHYKKMLYKIFFLKNGSTFLLIFFSLAICLLVIVLFIYLIAIYLYISSYSTTLDCFALGGLTVCMFAFSPVTYLYGIYEYVALYLYLLFSQKQFFIDQISAHVPAANHSQPSYPMRPLALLSHKAASSLIP